MKSLLGGLALAMVLAGCGGSSSGDAGAQASVSPTSSSSSEKSPAVEHTRDPFAPNTGKYALKVGQPRLGQEIVSTLLSVKRPMISAAEPYLKPDEPSQEFMGAEVRTCVRRSSKHKDPVVWSDWIASARNGNIFHGW